MRTYKTEEMVIVKRTTLDKEICDICEKEIDDCGNDNRIKIEARIGANYPECDTRDYYRLDVCEKCFFKVKAVLQRELKATFTEGRSDEFDYNGDEIDE